MLVILNHYHPSLFFPLKQAKENPGLSSPQASLNQNPPEQTPAVAAISDAAIPGSNLPPPENALVAGTNVHTTAVNLLRSSSFETEVGGKPRGWIYLLDSNTGNTHTSPEGNRSGASGLKFAGGGTGNFAIAQPDTKTVPGRTYTLSAYIKYTNVPPVTLRLGFWNEYLNTEGETKSFNLSGAKDWTRISMTTATPGLITDYANQFPIIYIHGLTKGAVYLDDLQLEEGGSLTEYNSAQAKPMALSSIGDGSIIFTPGADIFPAFDGIGSIGAAANKFTSLHLTNASIDKDGNLTVNGTTIKGSLNIEGNLLLGSSTIFSFLGFGTGIVHSDASGVLSSSALNLAGGSSKVTGVLPLANGGIGLNITGSSITNGQLLIGNNSAAGFSLAALTAGSGISINNGSGAITISQTGGGASKWTQTDAQGVLTPNISTLDLLLGGTATSSAKFAILNMAGGGTPTASISANSGNNALYLTGDGTLSTTNRQTLTLGNSATFDTTGNILLHPNSTGKVGIGTADPQSLVNIKGVNPVLTIGDTRNQSFTVGDQFAAIDFSSDDISSGGFTNKVRARIAALQLDTFGASQGLAFYTTRIANEILTEQMRISENGNVGIATTTPFSSPNSSRALTIVGSGGGGNSGSVLQLAAQDSSSIDGSNLGYLEWHNRGASSSNTRSAYIGVVLSGTPGSANIGSYMTFATEADGADGTGTERMRIDNQGNLGIGTTSPLEKLDVSGNATASGNLTLYGAARSIQTTAMNTLALGGSTTGNLSFNSGGTTAMTILPNGNVGIRTANPMIGLHVKKDSGIYLEEASATRQLRLIPPIGSNGAIIQVNQTNNPLHFITGNGNTTPRMTIYNTGNVGIGTGSDPGSKLEIIGTSGTYPTVRIAHSSDNVAGEFLRIGRTDSGFRYHSIFAQQSSTGAANNYLAFNLHNSATTTSQIEVLRLVGTGNVGINTTSPLATLDVRGNSSTTAAASISAQSALAGLVVDNTGNGDLFTASKSGATKFTILNNGNVEVIGTATTCTIGNGTSATNCSSSDRSLKENIASLSEGSGLDAIKLLNPVSFNWNPWMQTNGAPSDQQFGLIAQDVAKTFPNLVLQDKNTGYYKLDYQGLIGPMIKSIQELDAKVATLSSSLTQTASPAVPAEELGIDRLDLKDATISGTLTVLDRALLSDVGITGKITSGLLTLNGLNSCTRSASSCASINTLSAPLALQSHGLYGLNILDGKVTIAENGDIKTQGEITAKKYAVDTNDAGASSLGEAVLPAGDTGLTIETTAVSSRSAIFITADSPLESPLFILSKDPGISFTVGIKKAQPSDIKFHWWIVN